MGVSSVFHPHEPKYHFFSMHPTTPPHVPSLLAITHSLPTEETLGKRKFEEMSKNVEVSRNAPPWEVLSLIAGYMDPETLAVASCVSKTWNLCFSSDHLWRPLFNARHPSLSAAFKPSMAKERPISYKRLYFVAQSATKRRRVKQPSKPKVSLSDLIFTLNMSGPSMNVAIVKAGKDLLIPSNGLFRFDVQVNQEKSIMAAASEMKELKVTWNIVLGEWEAAFTMMDDFKSLEAEGWFSEELPVPECCTSSCVTGSGMAADIKIGFMSHAGNIRVEKISLGIMNTIQLRYLTVEDGLRYLQHFLLRKDVPRF